jgi:hypothetical protein
MKLANANEVARISGRPGLIQEGNIITTVNGKYRVVRVNGSTVTADRIPTFFERLSSFCRAVIHPYRWALQHREHIASLREVKGGTSAQKRDRRRSA